MFDATNLSFLIYNPRLKTTSEALLRKPILLLTFIFAGIILAACASKTDAPAKAVENYLNALVNKDSDKLSTLVCGDWEQDAMIELDSFQAVTATLENVSCSQTGSDGDTSLVLCKGDIVASYNGEDQKLDLSTRTYQVVQQSGDWLVCGTR
jgi:hypothetical protein